MVPNLIYIKSISLSGIFFLPLLSPEDKSAVIVLEINASKEELVSALGTDRKFKAYILEYINIDGELIHPSRSEFIEFHSRKDMKGNLMLGLECYGFHTEIKAK